MQFPAMVAVRRRVGDRTIVAALIGAGIALRASWNALRPTVSATGEALHVAVAFAQGRGIADAYGPGTGATAHFYPFTPGLGGIVYSLLGIRSLASEILLACWSIGLCLATYLIVMRSFARLGTPANARLVALAFACMAPTYISQEAVDFRLWDGAATALLMALLLDNLLILDADPSDRRSIYLAGATCAGLLAVNLPSGLAGIAAAALLAWRRLSRRQSMTLVATTVALLLVLVTPWAVRNEAVFGAFVPSRSNAGLELAIGMDPQSLTAPDRMKRFNARLRELHPVFTRNHPALAAAGGEIGYSKLLLRETADWMAAHPWNSLQLFALHLRQQFAPEPWQFAVFGQAALSPTLRSVLATAVSLAGLLGIGIALIRRRRGWIYLMIMVAGLSATTLPFQPMKRYTYLYYPFLLFAAADLLSQVGGARSRRTREQPA